MSAGKKIEYQDLVKDHVRFRLTESSWTKEVSQLIRNAIMKRIADGQAPKTIKFEELYADVYDKARDIMSIEMEQECHTKVNEYLSQNRNDLSGSTDSSDVLSPGNSSDVSTGVATNKMDET